jgi:hypothetical protein
VKTASFTVRATEKQSLRWKRAADAEGHASVGTWLADAADAYLQHRASAGRPLPLSWRRGRFPVLLEDGEVTVRGFTSEPFHAFRGTFKGADPLGDHYSLVYCGRIMATLKTYAQCKALASELAPVLIRGDPSTDPDRIIERHRREAM